MKICPIQNTLAATIKRANMIPQIVKPYGFDSVSFGSDPKDINNIKNSFHNPIKIVFSDVDETITRHSHAPKANIDAIKKLHKANIPIILCTGRTYEHAKPLFAPLGTNPDYVITQQGCVILDKNGQIIYENVMSAENAFKIIELADKYREKDPNTHLLFYFDGEPHSTEDFDFSNCMSENIIRTDSLCDLLEKGLRPTKAFLVKTDSSTYSDLDPVKTFFRDGLGKDLNVFNSAKRYCEITNCNISKGLAMEFLAERLGVDLKNAAAFGDAENDMSMMQVLNKAGGLSVAMVNGVDSLKSEAKFIAPPVDEAGFAKTIDVILANNKRLGIK